jgi:hypothetical protein
VQSVSAAPPSAISKDVDLDDRLDDETFRTRGGNYFVS